MHKLKESFEGNKELMRNACILLACVCTVLMFDMSFKLSLSEFTENTVRDTILELKNSIENTFFETSFFSAVLFWLCISIRTRAEDLELMAKGGRERLPLFAVCAFIAAVWVCAESFQIDSTIDNLHNHPAQIIKTIIYWIGAMNILLLFERLFCLIVEKSEKREYKKEKSFLLHFAIIFIVWLPHAVIAYPAVIVYDAWTSLSQYFGYMNMSTHHPVAYTALIGLFTGGGMQ